MKNKKLSAIFDIQWRRAAATAVLSAALPSCGFVRVLLLEPFDEPDLGPLTFNAAATDRPEELLRTTLVESRSDLQATQKQNRDDGLKSAVDRFLNFNDTLSALLNHPQASLLKNVPVPAVYAEERFQNEGDAFAADPVENLVRPAQALVAPLSKHFFQRAQSKHFTVLNSELGLRVLRYPVDSASPNAEAKVNATYFSQQNGPLTNAPDCRAQACATAKEFLTGQNEQAGETSLDAGGFSVTLQNSFVRSFQTYTDASQKAQLNNYQLAVQCARATFAVSGIAYEKTWPRMASLILNSFGKDGGTQRYVMVANTLVLAGASLAAPVERIEAVARPQPVIDAEASKLLRVKAFQFAFDGTHAGARFEYHQYLVPFFSRLWSTTQSDTMSTSYFTATVPKGRSILFKNESARTAYGNALLPSPAQVAWLGANWQVDNVTGPMPIDPWSTPQAFHVYDRNGQDGAIVKESDFNRGGALYIQPSATEAPYTIDKLVLTMPEPDVAWDAAKFSDDVATMYQLKEFFASLPSQCEQTMAQE